MCVCNCLEGKGIMPFFANFHFIILSRTWFYVTVCDSELKFSSAFFCSCIKLSLPELPNK